MVTAAWVVSAFALALSGLHFYRVRSAAGFLLMVPKLIAGALSLYIALAGAAVAFVASAAALPAVEGALPGLRAGLAVPGALGALAAWLSSLYAVRAGSPRADFAEVFGPEWLERIPAETRRRLPRRGWNWLLPGSPPPVWHRDVTLWRLPDTDRPLLADIWEPAEGVERSGLAFLYFHGSAWHFLDKDFGTRAFFRHLTGQGHVVVDVAYRLCPETDLFGMVADVKRAVVWMKENADRYGVDPSRVVVGGGSAGAHIALLAAYLAGDRGPAHRFTEPDLAGRDTSVAGVVSFYGPTDMRACYEHTGARIFNETARLLGAGGDPPGPAGRFLARFLRAAPPRLGYVSVLAEGVSGIVRNALGVAPEEAGELWDLASPAAHVRADVPPTLIFQGDADCLVPVEATREFYERLRRAGARALYVEYPWTEHAFDLGVVRLSPPAQNAVYHLDRFLAFLASSS